MKTKDPFKTLVIDAIEGVGFAGSLILATECQKAGLAKFTGNQWNPGWKWDRKALEAVDMDKLQALYQSLCEERESAEERAVGAAAVVAQPNIILPDNVIVMEPRHAD